MRGRYAPSPTGALHLGNLRTALLAWLFARHAGGAFVLRVEDLDLPRVRPGAAAQMLADLRWLGLDWDEGPDAGGALGPYIQSARTMLYADALVRLRAAGRLYPCYCTRAELSRLASAPQGGDDERGYPGTCRSLSARERARHERVVDDALMGITQVVRGADLLSSTARQLALFDALGYRRPDTFAHVPLVTDGAGARLAKRDKSAGVAGLRERGVCATTVLGALAASCGLWPANVPVSLAELLAAFAPERIQSVPSAVMA